MKIDIKCDRCGTIVHGTKTEDFTGGYYDLGSNSFWRKMANAKDTEFIICDNCMFTSPEYIKLYENIYRKRT